ncbi:hypothetical protein EC844_103172 [Acinetobacter calcoaceticus]|uniref:Uncharacterized protein n=1 Tax=Acinetobacter calcoaceticus TaxID=471 RepID=A0A4R1Y2X7_ACICA|nr:hypothetical protein EC844_103172 [Acinetobacter calcoaceticus]
MIWNMSLSMILSIVWSTTLALLLLFLARRSYLRKSTPRRITQIDPTTTVALLQQHKPLFAVTLTAQNRVIAEAKLNLLLKHNPTQYSLYLDLLELHISAQDQLAIQQLMKYINTLNAPELLTEVQHRVNAADVQRQDLNSRCTDQDPLNSSMLSNMMATPISLASVYASSKVLSQTASPTSVEQSIISPDFAQNDSAQNNLAQNDLAQNDATKNDATQNHSDQNNLLHVDLGSADVLPVPSHQNHALQYKLDQAHPLALDLAMIEYSNPQLQGGPHLEQCTTTQSEPQPQSQPDQQMTSTPLTPWKPDMTLDFELSEQDLNTWQVSENTLALIPAPHSSLAAVFELDPDLGLDLGLGLGLGLDSPLAMDLDSENHPFKAGEKRLKNES